MQLGIGIYHCLAQPGPVFVVAQAAALVYHALEVAVDGDQVLLLVDEGTHRVADVYLAGQDDEALVGTVPHRLVLVAE